MPKLYNQISTESLLIQDMQEQNQQQNILPSLLDSVST